MKRQRERPIDYEVMDGYVVLNYEGKQYMWTPRRRVSIDAFLNEETYDYTITQTKDGQAMFNVESLRRNKDVLRQEVNLLKDKNVPELVKDE